MWRLPGTARRRALAAGGPALTVLWRLTAPGFQRRERAAFAYATTVSSARVEGSYAAADARIDAEAEDKRARRKDAMQHGRRLAVHQAGTRHDCSGGLRTPAGAAGAVLAHELPYAVANPGSVPASQPSCALTRADTVTNAGSDGGSIGDERDRMCGGGRQQYDGAIPHSATTTRASCGEHPFVQGRRRAAASGAQLRRAGVSGPIGAASYRSVAR
jgi:hypothetical protein